MSKEAISRVREAETQAADIRGKAEKQAQDRMEACEKRCAETAARQIEEAAAELKARLEAVRVRADELIAESRQDALGDAIVLTKQAAAKKQEAVKAIVWGMFDSCQ